jgi:hypothetical protein
MNFKKIIGFGDSWMYGDELLDPELEKNFKDAHTCWLQNTPYRDSHNFLGLIGQHYGAPIENFGLPGGSLQSTIWTFLWWLEHEPEPEKCLVLIGLTDADRVSHYDPNHVSYDNDPPWNKYVHSTWVEFGSSVVPEPFRHMIKSQIVLTNCAELNKLNYLQSVLLFDGVAARQKLPLLQFHIMPEELDTKCPTVIWPGFSTTIWFREHPENRKKELVKPGGHPNEKGHRLLADKLISEIDRAIIM